MTPVLLQFLSFEFEHPARHEPAWKSRVDRWYQLDAFAFGLCEAYANWKPRLAGPPSLLILASPAASNETDRLFAETDGTSPARFAHTLPNIRSSPLCQVMGWNGPMLCVQKDPSTIETALLEGVEFVSSEWPSVWILAVFKRASHYRVEGFVLTLKTGAETGALHEVIRDSDEAGDGRLSELSEWTQRDFKTSGTSAGVLGKPVTECRLPRGYRIRTISRGD